MTVISNNQLKNKFDFLAYSRPRKQELNLVVNQKNDSIRDWIMSLLMNE